MRAVAIWSVFWVALLLSAYLFWFEFRPRASTYVDASGKRISTFDKKMFFAPSSVAGRLRELEPHHAAYRRQQATVDMIFPVAYGLTFISALVGVGAPRWLLLVPLIAVAADYVENFTVIALIDRFPDVPGGLTYVLSLASAVKGVTFYASVLLSLGYAWRWA